MNVYFLRNNFENINISMKIYADELVQGFKNEKIDIDLFQILPTSKNFQLLTQSIRGFTKLRNYYERYVLYPKILKDIDTNLFHIIDHAYSYLLKHIEGKKVVITCHDLILLKLLMGEFGSQKAPFFASYLFKNSIAFLEKANKIISVSENTKADLIKLLSIKPQKIVTVPNGINSRFFKYNESQLTEKNQKKDSKKFTLLHIGGNWFYKNIEGIIKAVGLLKNDLKKRVTLLKVGGDLTKDQQKLIKINNLQENIKVIRFADPKELPNIYQASDLFVFPSLYEGFGWPPLEAMASGIPVIVSNRASLPEVCGDAAIYIDPLNYKEIALAIEHVLTDNKLRENLIEKGLKRAKMFSWEETARKTYEVYKEVLGDKD